MKKIIYTALISASFSSLVNASGGIYTSVKAGISDTKYKNSEDAYYYGREDSKTAFLNNNLTKSIYPTISAAIGYDFSAISPVNVRAELEYTYKDKTNFQPTVGSVLDYMPGQSPQVVDNGGFESDYQNSLQSQSLMLNAYYDFRNTSKFTPYVSAGAGVTHVKNKQTVTYDNSTTSDSDNHFTWSAGAGIAYAVSQNVALDLSYKYVDAGKYEFNYPTRSNMITNNRTNVKLASNEYLLGVRYNF